MKNFAMTGVAGYIAPRHLQAIKDTGNHLVAAIDPHDSVGILDRFFPNVSFFTEIERFDRHLELLRRGPAEGRVDYLTICSPNNLHDAHIRLALRIGADAICEKPVVLNPWNLDALEDLEHEYGHSVFTVLQLRVHPALIALQATLEKSKLGRKRDVVLTYVTSRGPWYSYSWKGASEKSGGIATNIGVHLFDLLLWLFGKVETNEVHLAEPTRAAGFLELRDANVRWFLSINRADLPDKSNLEGKSTFRSIRIDSEEVEFSEGFANLHTTVYEDILRGGGFRIPDSRPAIETVYAIRSMRPGEISDNCHPRVKELQTERGLQKQ